MFIRRELYAVTDLKRALHHSSTRVQLFVSSSAVEGTVGPVALDLPLGFTKFYRIAPESPCALIGVLGATAVIPGIQLRIGQRFRQFMTGDVAKRRNALGMAGRSVFRIAAGVAIEIEEEGEGDAYTAATGGTVPGTELGAATRLVNVNGIEAIRHRIRDHFADFTQYLRSALAIRPGRGQVNDVPAEGNCGPDVPDRIRVFGVCPA